MKSTLIFVAMIFIICAACTVPGELRADKMDKAYKKADNIKTWVVYDATGGHMSKGDKFRIKFQGNKYEFKPLFKLRTKWGQKDDPDYSVNLEKKEDDAYLCGMAKVQSEDHKYKTGGHGDWHGFVIRFPIDDLEDMEITWSDEDLEGPLTGNELMNMCDATASQYHGGRAHAEPN